MTRQRTPLHRCYSALLTALVAIGCAESALPTATTPTIARPPQPESAAAQPEAAADTPTASPEPSPPPPRATGTLAEAKRQAAEFVPEGGNVECEPSGDAFKCDVSPGYGRCWQVYTCPGTPGGRCEEVDSQCIPLP